ncbi:MAG: metal-dependent hydrolase [Desulfobacteraceae bacterium]|nr:MAG: metal-dependent hydrolase [Desulfobacteraceae bacterium]
MSPITHLLASWTSADLFRLDSRNRTLVTLCGLLPDLDGIGILADLSSRIIGKPDQSFYTLFHHSLLHGLPAAILIPGLLALFATRRLLVFSIGFLVYHLHLLFDLLGARGITPDDIWPVPYLAPFSDRLTLSWSYQWPLNSPINIIFTIVLLGYVFYRAVKSGYSPVGIFHKKADIVFTAVVKTRWQSLWLKR